MMYHPSNLQVPEIINATNINATDKESETPK